MTVRRCIVGCALAALAALVAGCGSSGAKRPEGWVHPIGAYVAPGCSDAAEQRGPQYVVVASWIDGKLTGNTGDFTGVPKCGNVIVYVDADERDEVRIPSLRIAETVAPGKTAKLEFYAPDGKYRVVLRRAKVQVVRVVVE